MLNAESGKTWRKLSLIKEHARQDPDLQFTSLAHLLNKEFLRDCHKSLNRNKAVGVDEVGWEDYDSNLEENLDDLVGRLKRKAFKPLPARRVYIPKSETEERPLGISAHENKVVERGITWILESIYEIDFLDCSYGFRPNRDCHQALRTMGEMINSRPVNHVVQYFEDANRIERALKNRFERYGLEIHPEKSRNISFGSFERENAARQKRKPNTFDFLGFTHYCDETRKGRFKVGRKTRRKKFNAKCKELNDWLKSVRNLVKTKEWWNVLRAKLRGHYQYYGVSENSLSILKFYRKALRLTHKWMNRRSQKKKMNWREFNSYLEKYPLPKPRIAHSFYENRMQRKLF